MDDETREAMSHSETVIGSIDPPADDGTIRVNSVYYPDVRVSAVFDTRNRSSESGLYCKNKKTLFILLAVPSKAKKMAERSGGV